MENKSFLKTKEGGLTLAFIVIIVAFVLILAGLSMQGDTLCFIGFILMTAAMLYSPFKVYIVDRKKKS